MLTSPICNFDAGPISYPFRAEEGIEVSRHSWVTGQRLPAPLSSSHVLH